ncbi:glycoside hydrolase family 16 [Trichoderma arundinaceum]|uniref:endo-1,3(4)-beta-glucanase n=1 Tax=Trichoderma arundinaceum TaxID=490622 RepID=A0A395P122_TRIAR|nr:glycoside hydrolase family 16 [Trichoderma arundinaceum]
MYSSAGIAFYLGALFATRAAHAQYTLGVTYDASNFFSSFNFFTDSDPTHGFVEYVDAQTANSLGLAGTSSGGVYMGVDSTTQNPSNGRKSVRVTSQQSFNHGLFIADIAHMPGSICGAWPAMWMVGPNWPSSGEIDIIEGVNTQTTDSITLHTSPGFTVSNDGSDPSTVLVGSDCGAGNGNSGCGQSTSDNQNYGDGFNAIGGGVYATEWTSDHISVWFFPRTNIPADISSGSPNPSGWGNPLAKFSGANGSNVDDYFKDNQIVFDTTFCGDWAGNVWGSNGECSALANSCEDYVSNNPSAFAEAYWVVNSINVYNQASNATAVSNTSLKTSPKRFRA